MEVAIVAFDEFTDIDVFLPWDILNRVKLPGWIVQIYGTSESHISVTGLTVPVHMPIDELSHADAVLFASGPGTRKLYQDEQYLKRINVNPSEQLVTSMCSGALLLGALGLLDGKRATTYPTVKEELAQFNVNIVEESLVVENNIATAAGCLAAQDLSFWIIEKLTNENVKNEVWQTIQPIGQKLA
ncbi:DJ-1/PfpI family protein [Cytobacillus purgationiresistens]|uniref:Transcriptional regulator GlxA family with amidase domain n=1 Tax=Cytobacillus purgationiresistens TaxID=863449 RepID=A0ABU0AAC3_9BACI|nr:DJ-1/PfpI family protein [Cytobacillus purgationiresistens]MDQ0268199.1 transcriptional regulator GlxA family with amidase domain [Cytobacillus purgationiresistens]